MNESFNIKGLYPKQDLYLINLQELYITTINGTIPCIKAIKDIFEINITSSIMDITHINFNDMILNIIKCNFSFNVIAINDENNGIFFKYNSISDISLKKILKVNTFDLLLIDSTFDTSNENLINFSLVIGVNSNPKKNLNNNFIPQDEGIKNEKIYLDKEFI